MNNIKTFENFNNQDIFTYVEDGNIQLVKNYINSGYDLNIQNYNDDGYTPLIYAILKDNIEIVELLLNAGADIKIVKLLLNADADVDKQNINGDTALIFAVKNLEIVKLLLDSGADIDKQSYEDNWGFYPYKVTNGGNTALIQAASNNRREMIELLLDYGADEFVINYDGKSFYYLLNDENKEYFTQNYPTSVYNAISHNYKKSFIEFVKDFGIKIKK